MAGELSALLGGDPLLLEAAQVSFRHIAFLEREIAQMEKLVEGRVKLHPKYELLLTVPGIGRILMAASNPTRDGSEGPATPLISATTRIPSA